MMSSILSTRGIVDCKFSTTGRIIPEEEVSENDLEGWRVEMIRALGTGTITKLVGPDFEAIPHWES